MTPPTEPLGLARALIRCPSVTPEDAGALDVLKATLDELGFSCHKLVFSEEGTADVANLYARLGDASPNFCFAGHTDVVPVGNPEGWDTDPFGAEVIDGHLCGRGAADMKGAIASFVAALARFLVERPDGFDGSISLLITGDEETLAINGTVKVLDWLKERGETLDVCLVGEPTNPEKLGDMIKIGRRGSLVGHLTVFGTQGHTAYGHLADNPIPRLIEMLRAITEKSLDEGTDHFQPSAIEISTIDTGNAATNLIPDRTSASFNIRFNDLHSSASIERWLRQTFDEIGGDEIGGDEIGGDEIGGDKAGGRYELKLQVSGEAFLCPPGEWSELVADAVERTIGIRPELSTSGGTSDARFIHRACPVAEFGLPGKTMHKANERTALDDLEKLADIYKAVLDAYFARR
ncbi:MAG: succinyl-diaminopimelate desuccinylase [Proteobacteria bacterium]|nr:succinyl-diaminopimelate desuccinylase [Pseudomonadota bacterium]